MKLATEKKLQRHMIRFLMIDSQQTSFNAICRALEEQHYTAQGKLLDDINSFEKALNLQWDVILFNNAYDFDYKKALNLLEAKGKSTPLILLSTLDSTYPEILEAYQLGTYAVISATNYHFLTLNIYRASVYTRLVRREHQLSVEIDQLQQHTQSLVETTEHAVAIFQEGVHVSANEQYAKLFGSNSADDLLGQPILDILQPSDIPQFKAAFKRLSKDDFSQANFNIETVNTSSKQKNLMLQFAATEFEGDPSLQLVIPTDSISSTTNNGNATTVGGFHNLERIQGEITGILLEKPIAGLSIFRINILPDSLLLCSWDVLPAYFKQFEKILSQHCSQGTIFRVSENTFVVLQAYDNEKEATEKYNTTLKQLPVSIDLDNQIFSFMPQKGFIALNSAPTLDKLRTLINDATKGTEGNKDTIQSAPLFSLSLDNDGPLEIPENVAQETIPTAPVSEIPTSTAAVSLGEVILNKNDDSPSHFASKITTNDGSHVSLLEQIENNTIELQFQQLYDKEDIDTHIYEATASFTHENNRIDISNYGSLDSNPELAVKLDRWVLVEASKRLHQFLNNCPKARIVINLHSACFNDSSLVMLLTKLVSLINSKYNKPLILQFNEENILTDMDNATKFFHSVQEYGIGITIANFGKSTYSTNILSQAKPIYAKLAPDFSDFLQSDDGMVELQEKLDEFQEQYPELRFVLGPLDDMTMFANAWNVNARYLQGNYFQAKQKEFVDNAN